MIRNPSDIPNKPKRIRMLIAGHPGIGKSTLALSAPGALHVDVDFGIDRIEPMHRRPYIQPKTYDEILSDLKPENVRDFESLIFDTGGKLISLMSLWAIKKDPKNAKRDGTLAIQGYGTVGKEFVRLMDYCYYELDKHIVCVFHAIEDKDGDSTRLRLMVEGQTKNTVWIPMDLGGFMEMYGNNRTLGLSNCERYFAKGSRGINGILPIPSLQQGTPNDFLKRLFDDYNANALNEASELSEQRKKYEAAIEAGNAIIEDTFTAEEANANILRLKGVKHALSSEKELITKWNRHMKALGLEFSKLTQRYQVAGANEG